MTSGDFTIKTPSVLSIVVPCFNEEDVLRETYARLSSLRDKLIGIGKISRESEILFVDDGSRDKTWDLVDSWSHDDARVVGVKLSRNCGHQNALLAGLSSARGDAVITIDADLQDDEGAIERMVDAFHGGNEVVYGVRARRDADTAFKRITARLFYRAMMALGVQTVFDHADYRLLSRRAVEFLGRFGEANLFLRGVIPLLGLRSAIVYYDRRARFAGKSKYPVGKMLEFAWSGITSFSTAPLRAIALLGFTLSLLCLVLAGWALLVKFHTPNAVPGWASTILPIYFLGGVQLLCAGVVGEYIGKIYMEVKRRPRFFVERMAGQSHDLATGVKKDVGRQRTWTEAQQRWRAGASLRHSLSARDRRIRCEQTGRPVLDPAVQAVATGDGSTTDAWRNAEPLTTIPGSDSESHYR